MKQEPLYQLDLIYKRKDRVYTIVEIKYTSHKLSASIIGSFERKLELFPNPQNYAIQKVLVCNMGVEDSVINRHYFDRIITLDDL